MAPFLIYLGQAIQFRAFLDARRVLIVNGNAFETADFCVRKRLSRHFVVRDGDKISLVASPN